MQGFVAESFYGAYIKNRGDCCKYYKDKYVINRVYKTCLKNIIVGLFFNQSVVIVKIPVWGLVLAPTSVLLLIIFLQQTLYLIFS